MILVNLDDRTPITDAILCLCFYFSMGMTKMKTIHRGIYFYVCHEKDQFNFMFNRFKLLPD